MTFDASFVWGELGVVLSTIAGVYLHEAGHMLAGRWAGLHPRLVQLGSGPALARWQFGRLLVVVRAWPFSGFAGMLPQPGSRPRAHAIMLVGGPATNAVLFGLAAAGAAVWPAAQDALIPVLITQGLLVVFTLVPFDIRLKGQLHRSDGMRLLRCWRGTADATFEVFYQAVIAPIYPPGLTLPPASPDAPELLFQWLRPDRWLDQWARTNAQEIVAGLLERRRLTVPEQALALHFLLTNELSFGDTGSSDDWMRYWSYESIRIAPDTEPTPLAVLLTHAGTLSRLGEAGEAEALLNVLTGKLRQPGSIVSSHVYMAQAVALQGRRAEAAEWLARARAAAAGPGRKALLLRIGRAERLSPFAAMDPARDAAISPA